MEAFSPFITELAYDSTAVRHDISSDTTPKMLLKWETVDTDSLGGISNTIKEYI